MKNNNRLPPFVLCCCCNNDDDDEEEDGVDTLLPSVYKTYPGPTSRIMSSAALACTVDPKDDDKDDETPITPPLPPPSPALVAAAVADELGVEGDRPRCDDDDGEDVGTRIDAKLGVTVVEKATRASTCTMMWSDDDDR